MHVLRNDKLLRLAQKVMAIHYNLWVGLAQEVQKIDLLYLEKEKHFAYDLMSMTIFGRVNLVVYVRSY